MCINITVKVCNGLYNCAIYYMGAKDFCKRVLLLLYLIKADDIFQKSEKHQYKP